MLDTARQTIGWSRNRRMRENGCMLSSSRKKRQENKKKIKNREKPLRLFLGCQFLMSSHSRSGFARGSSSLSQVSFRACRLRGWKLLRFIPWARLVPFAVHLLRPGRAYKRRVGRLLGRFDIYTHIYKGFMIERIKIHKISAMEISSLVSLSDIFNYINGNQIFYYKGGGRVEKGGWIEREAHIAHILCEKNSFKFIAIILTVKILRPSSSFRRETGTLLKPYPSSSSSAPFSLIP